MVNQNNKTMKKLILLILIAGCSTVQAQDFELDLKSGQNEHGISIVHKANNHFEFINQLTYNESVNFVFGVKFLPINFKFDALEPFVTAQYGMGYHAKEYSIYRFSYGIHMKYFSLEQFHYGTSLDDSFDGYGVTVHASKILRRIGR